MNPGSVADLGSYRVDLQAGTLHDRSGALVTLRPQAWALLRQLLLHRGQVLSKQHLLEAIWPGLVVTDNSVAQAVKDLRSALGDDGAVLVKTIGRRGYLLADAGAAAVEPALPPAPPVLFGREADLLALQGMLQRHRLITVTGAGGIGKTALALAVAHALADTGASPVAWVDLARLTHAALIPAAVCQSLALPVAPSEDPVPAMLAALRPVHALVVLDNAEHLLDGVAQLVRRIVDAAPGIRLLVTSQAPLHLAGEQGLRLGALALPAPDAAAEQASQSAAVALFIDRVRAVDHRFEPDAHQISVIARLCRRLDGVPLALRLATARVPLLGLAGVESRLGERLQLLVQDDRDGPERHHMLRSALTWSYGLLADDEQALLRRLAVFVGGFTLEAITSPGGDVGTDPWPLIQRLNGLVERSLVERDGGDPPRFHLLESTREFALAELERLGETARARDRHARAMAQVLHEANAALWTMADASWLALWARELDNVRAALDWAAPRDAALFATLVGAAARLFRALDLAHELRRRAAAVDPLTIDGIHPRIAADYWLGRTHLESGLQAHDMQHFAIEAERHARRGADPRQLYLALGHRITAAGSTNEHTPALLAELRSIESPAWPPRLRAHGCLAEFVDAALRAEWAAALRAAEAGLALALAAESALMVPVFANHVLVALLGQGKVDEAVQRSGVLRQQVAGGAAAAVIPFIGTSARCWLESGDGFAAKRLLEQMFGLCRATGWTYFDFFADLYVKVALADQRLEAAARLLGHAQRAGQRAWLRDRPSVFHDHTSTGLVAALGASRVEELCAEGQRLGPEEVCTLLLGEPLLRESDRMPGSAGA